MKRELARSGILRLLLKFAFSVQHILHLLRLKSSFAALCPQAPFFAAIKTTDGAASYGTASWSPFVPRWASSHFKEGVLARIDEISDRLERLAGFSRDRRTFAARELREFLRPGHAGRKPLWLRLRLVAA